MTIASTESPARVPGTLHELVVLSDSVSIYRGDCRDILPTLGKVDAVVTDPPYGMAHPCNFAGRGRGNLAACNDWPDVAGDAEPFDPAWILDMNKPTVLWGRTGTPTSCRRSPGGWCGTRNARTIWTKQPANWRGRTASRACAGSGTCGTA